MSLGYHQISKHVWQNYQSATRKLFHLIFHWDQPGHKEKLTKLQCYCSKSSWPQPLAFQKPLRSLLWICVPSTALDNLGYVVDAWFWKLWFDTIKILTEKLFAQRIESSSAYVWKYLGFFPWPSEHTQILQQLNELVVVQVQTNFKRKTQESQHKFYLPINSFQLPTGCVFSCNPVGCAYMPHLDQCWL